MTSREQYFARVIPLLGKGLQRCTVRVSDVSLTARVVELLASCMLRRVILVGADAPVTWPLQSVCRGPARRGPPPATAAGLLARYLRFKNHFVAVQWLQRGQADLTIAASLLPQGVHPHVCWERRRRRVTLRLAPADLFSHQNVTWAVARQVREMLLGRAAWPEGTFFFGSRAWPFCAARRPLGAPPAPTSVERALEGKHVLVVGCGSVGSEAIRLLSAARARWTLVDGGSVSIFNPVRQWFGTRSVGRRKVDVLRRRLGAADVRSEPFNATAEHQDRFARLLDVDPPQVALLAAGTADHAILAEQLFARGIPHVAACAYPQARFFEVTTVIPAEGTPCLSCFRGHLYRGRESSPPLSDELAHFLYRELDGEERARAYEDLVAEPASAMETGRIADVAAQCVAEALLPPRQRGLWMQRMMREGTTCLLGGNTVEQGDGEPAYGISFPGQIVRLGLGDLVGPATERTCAVCGRQLEVSHRVQLPAAEEEDVDRGLLAG